MRFLKWIFIILAALGAVYTVYSVYSLLVILLTPVETDLSANTQFQLRWLIVQAAGLDNRVALGVIVTSFFSIAVLVMILWSTLRSPSEQP